jgi:hypothetical protein
MWMEWMDPFILTTSGCRHTSSGASSSSSLIRVEQVMVSAICRFFPFLANPINPINLTTGIPEHAESVIPFT